jgi:beta-aspartyl-peptidase (threonine type)
MKSIALGFFFSSLALGFSSLALGFSPPPETPRSLLETQVAAWNKKDLEGFMAGYWKSPELTFFGGKEITKGWQATLERYRKKYQSEGKEMGTLSFSDLEIQTFGATAFARGRWHLQFSDGKTAEGLFSLILKKLPEGWRIVHDHSS